VNAFEPAGGTPGRDPRRLGLGAAAIIVGYACVVGLISANVGGGEPGPPNPARPVSLAVLLMLPAAIATIASLRRSRPLFVAAGCLCFAQSFLSFAFVTIPFVVPAILLLTLAGSIEAVRSSRRAIVGGIAVIGLGIGAWIALFALTETVCWVARAGADGVLVHSRIPVSDSFTLGVGDVASGCDGGVTTVEGLALAAILAISAIAVAELSSRAVQVVGSGTNGPSAAETATNSGEP
jgi:hypothetical protein